MIAFICGSMFGGFIGVMTMALIIGGSRGERDDSVHESEKKDD